MGNGHLVRPAVFDLLFIFMDENFDPNRTYDLEEVSLLAPLQILFTVNLVMFVL